jgi:hypothetical protein
MTTTALTSELEAINTLLAAIGESSINTLQDTGMEDVAQAKSVLDRISREVQTRGWHFNSEEQFPLLRDSDGRIPVPGNCLKLSVNTDSTVVQRGARLYDKTNHTDIFTTGLTADVVFLLEWEDLPQSARQFIMIRACRVFQATIFGSETQYRFTVDEENVAKVLLEETEGETARYNVFTGGSYMAEMLDR